MKDFAVIADYPNSEELKLAAGAFRASVPMLLMRGLGRGEIADSPWVSNFWSKIVEFGQCDPVWEPVKEPSDEAEGLEKIVLNYRNRARADLKYRLDSWPVDLNNLAKYEVISALLARQATLAIEQAAAPPIWSPQYCSHYP